jgi:hypothetical protein
MITTTNVIIFILLTLMFISLECFVKWEIKLKEVLKLLPPSIIFSAILIVIWHVLSRS